MLSWLIGSLSYLPDGGEFLLSLAFIVSFSAPIPVVVTVVCARKAHEPLSLLAKISVWVALACFLWNVAFWLMFLLAYCCCPSGLC